MAQAEQFEAKEDADGDNDKEDQALLVCTGRSKPPKKNWVPAALYKPFVDSDATARMMKDVSITMERAVPSHINIGTAGKDTMNPTPHGDLSCLFLSGRSQLR